MAVEIHISGRITEAKLKQGGTRIIIQDAQIDDFEQLQSILEEDVDITVIKETRDQRQIKIASFT